MKNNKINKINSNETDCTILLLKSFRCWNLAVKLESTIALRESCVNSDCSKPSGQRESYCLDSAQFGLLVEILSQFLLYMWFFQLERFSNINLLITESKTVLYYNQKHTSEVEHLLLTGFLCRFILISLVRPLFELFFHIFLKDFEICTFNKIVVSTSKNLL